MKPITGFNEAQGLNEFEALQLGGHKCIIKGVQVNQTQTGKDQLVLVIDIAATGHTFIHKPHSLQTRSMCPSSGVILCDSGFEHQRHRNGQPLRKIVVLIPGPSCTLYLWMRNTRPRSCFKLFIDYYACRSHPR